MYQHNPYSGGLSPVCPTGRSTPSQRRVPRTKIIPPNKNGAPRLFSPNTEQHFVMTFLGDKVVFKKGGRVKTFVVLFDRALALGNPRSRTFFCVIS
jgi:hypothetical protein